MIAVDDQSDYPKSAPKTKLSGFTPNVEAVVGYHPDLVVISYSPKDFAGALAKAHIRVLVQPFATSFKDAYAQMLQLGRVTGHTKEARALVARHEEPHREAGQGAPKKALKVYNELTPDYYSATGASIIGEIFELFGLKNIADAAPGAGSVGAVQLSAEYIVGSSPDLIVLADTRCCGQSRAKVLSRPGWGTIAAVRKGAIARHRRLDRLALGAAARQLRQRRLERAEDDRQVGHGPGREAAAHRGRAGRGPAPACPRQLVARGWEAASRSCSRRSSSASRSARSSIGVGAIVESAASHVPFLGLHSHLSPSDSAVVWELRLPRVVLGLLVGAMLACAGATYQGVFRNPLVDPYLLGVAAGAGPRRDADHRLRAGPGFRRRPAPARRLRRRLDRGRDRLRRRPCGGLGRGTATFALAGVTVAAFLTAIQTFVQQQNSDTLQAVYSWILGSLDTAGWHDVLLLLPYAAVSAVVLLLHRRVLDVLTLGDEEASALGVHVGRVRLLLVAAATLGTAAAVAVSGLIGFLGIIVPHFVRLVAGGSYRVVLPLSMLVGGGFLVLADVLARTVVSPAELPIGVVTAFFGAPFFADRPAHGTERRNMTALAVRELSVELGGARVLDGVSARSRRGSG